jgi:hypothetical protein
LKKPPSRNSRRGSTRREYLLKLGGGAAIVVGLGDIITPSSAFTTATGSRPADAAVANDGNGLVGVVGQGPVQKNQREAMVRITNNSAETVSVTVALTNPNDGTLYDNEGGSGTSISFTLAPGNSQFVDISATIQGIVDYDISVSSSNISLDTSGSVEAAGGNANEFVRVSNVQKFRANSGPENNWTLQKVQIEDRDGDDDLDSVEYEILDSSGTIRYSETVNDIPGQQYQPQDLTFTPDDPSYDLPEGEQYTLTVTGYDVDGNFDSETVNATSTGTGSPPGDGGGGSCTIGSNNNRDAFQFNKLEKFKAKPGQDRWTVDVQVQDTDNDDDLSNLKFQVTDSGGTVRGSKSVAISGGQYQPGTVTIDADGGYKVKGNESFTLTVTVCDIDGNSRTQTL